MLPSEPGPASDSPPFIRWNSGWNDSTLPAACAAGPGKSASKSAGDLSGGMPRSPKLVNRNVARPAGAVRTVDVNGSARFPSLSAVTAYP